MTERVLTDEQIESFLARGHVTIPRCFTRDDARPWLDDARIRLGYDPDDRATWAESRVHMPSRRRVEVRDFAPKAWRAACELLGGEPRGGGTFVAADSVAPWRACSPTRPRASCPTTATTTT